MFSTKRLPQLGAAFLCALLVGQSTSGAPGQPTPIKAGDAGSGPSYRLDFAGLPSDEAGARTIAMEFLKPGADHSKITAALRPQRAHFHEFFSARIAERMYWMYAVDWRNGRILVKPRRGQTNLILKSATVEELRKQRGLANFPNGYQRILADLRGGHRIFVLTYTKPDETEGRSFDGLVYVRDRWVIFPQPWSTLRRSARQKLDPSLQDSRNWRKDPSRI